MAMTTLMLLIVKLYDLPGFRVTYFTLSCLFASAQTVFWCKTSLLVFCVGWLNTFDLVLSPRRTQSTGQEPLRRQGSSAGRAPQPLSAQAIKHIWVRTALFEKVLDKIVQHIVDNARYNYNHLHCLCLNQLYSFVTAH